MIPLRLTQRQSYLEDLKRRVSMVCVDGKLYAFDDLCPHRGAPLSAGLFTGLVSIEVFERYQRSEKALVDAQPHSSQPLKPPATPLSLRAAKSPHPLSAML